MATYTSNYGWTKPGGNDQVDISVLNANLDSQDGIMHKAFTNMAQAFSAASTYAVGDIVLYDNELYKCHTAVTVAGAWTGSTNWTSWTLAEGGGGTSDYPDLTNKPSINSVTLSGNKTTSDLGIDKNAVGLGNVPNVSTNDQEPTFTEASTRNNIASGEKLSVILGKIAKFFNDLKTVAFTGSYNDLTNKPETTVIDWEDWIELTPQEQEAGNYTITDCPWADGNVSVDLMTKLWENPDVTQSFAAQYVDISSSDFDLFFVIAGYSNSATSSVVSIIANDNGGYINYAYPSSSGATSYSRWFTIDKSTNKVRFYDASTAMGTAAATVNNARLIPIAIYGIKTTASVKINAIAMDVSTSADKCMLSDGVTSVEDALGTEKLIKQVTADGVKTYKDLLLELYTSANNYTGFAQLRIGSAYFSPASKTSFNRIIYSSNTFYFETVNMESTNATYHKGEMTTSGTWAYTNMSATVPSSGTKIGLYKCN